MCERVENSVQSEKCEVSFSSGSIREKYKCSGRPEEILAPYLVCVTAVKKQDIFGPLVGWVSLKNPYARLGLMEC